MDRLPPIPTPPGQLWREFRIRVAPAILFVTVAGLVTFLWRANVSTPTLVGEVETVRANVSSPKAGRLARLEATRLQQVHKDDVIAKVITTDPQILQSSLAVIQAEIGLMRINLEPVLGQQRFAIGFDRLRLDWMDQRVQLVSSRVRLEFAESELRRAEQLFNEKIISAQLLDAARTAKQTLQAEVEERAHLVSEQEQRLKVLGIGENGSPYPADKNPEDVLNASIKVQEEKLRLTEAELSPITLTAPMDGTISIVHRHSGEAIAAGEPIVTLTAASSDRIVGYVRQPLAFEPKVGMEVEVRARSRSRCISRAEIIQVGSQMEAISASLLPPNSSQLHAAGLPVLVSLPTTQKLLPGEIVDLRILPERVHAGGSASGATLH